MHPDTIYYHCVREETCQSLTRATPVQKIEACSLQKAKHAGETETWAAFSGPKGVTLVARADVLHSCT